MTPLDFADQKNLSARGERVGSCRVDSDSWHRLMLPRSRREIGETNRITRASGYASSKIDFSAHS
jgi:hypothetical protein